MKTFQKIFICFALFLVAALQGCEKNRAFETYHSFPNQAWDRFETIEMAVMIENTDPLYDVFFVLDHDTSKPGSCIFELEVLIPRVEIPGIHRIGIVMEITDPED